MAMASRAYSSPLRADQVRLGRERIAAASAELFPKHGYAATTIGAIAKQAGVSLQTVYNSVGGKPNLLALAYTWALHGATEPPVVFETDAFREMLASTDARDGLVRYSRIARSYSERAGGVATVIMGERGTPEVVKIARILERQRLRGCEELISMIDRLGGLRADLTPKAAAEFVWVAIAPEPADRLVNGRGWTWDEYEHWLEEYFIRMLLP
jgi:AcrR family transcriptional regulator